MVALAGNPNSGKTSLFNAVTGARRRVGNYPGVTVERTTGMRRHRGRELEILDLPGAYSLTAASPEEQIARAVLVSEGPDAVVVVLDATSLERNLYLALQVLELGLPTVIALNMVDAAHAAGIEFDVTTLAADLGVPVVATVARRGEGVCELLDAVCRTLDGAPPSPPLRLDYGPHVERELARLEGLLAVVAAPPARILTRAVALGLLADQAEAAALPSGVRQAAAGGATRVERDGGEPADLVLATARHRAAAACAGRAERRPLAAGVTLTERLDRVLVSRYLGLPIFLAALYAVFWLTFRLAEPVASWIETATGWLAAGVTALWPVAVRGELYSLLVDGVIGGVGGVLVFLPNIVLLFLAISLLEDTGYMARAAFLMDRVMRSIGLHGRSFIPMLLGFGCSVPAIMATRTIESRRARLTTMLVIPLMSCGARLPIYALLIPAFFPAAWQAPALWAIYVVGVALAMAAAWLLRRTVFAGAGLPFVMELPPYRLPAPRTVLAAVWSRAWSYLRKAGTVILAIAIVMWALSTYPRLPHGGGGEVATDAPVATDSDLRLRRLEHSAAGRLGVALEPALRPMGFDWQIGTALVGAFAAKEVFVAQLGIVNAVGDGAGDGAAGLRQRLRERYSPLTAFCVMLFCLIASPCMATVAVTRRESGSWGWAALQFGGLTAVAWVVTTVVFQAGTVLGL